MDSIDSSSDSHPLRYLGDPKDIQAVIFDVGGVLLVPRNDQCIDGQTAREFAAFFRSSFHSEYHVTSFQHRWHQFEVGEIDEESFFTLFCEAFADANGKEISPHAAREAVWGSGLGICNAMVEAVREIRKVGKRTAIISNAGRDAFGDVPEIGHADLFDVTIVSGNVGIRKPDPAIYELALDMLNLPAQACCFIDDLEHNLIPAKELGIRTIHCHDPELLAGQLVDFLIGSNGYEA